MNVTIESIVERWSGLERPLFKGKLIDTDGCRCAQGDTLFCAGYTDEQLRAMDQRKADLETARILGISVRHSILLRTVNDNQSGCPQLVLTNPEQIIGDKAPLLLAFWKYLDQMTPAARDAAWDAAWAAAARDAAWDAAWAAAWDAAAWDAARAAAARDAAWDAARAAAARDAAWDAAWAAAWDAARAASWASSEIQGMDILERNGRKPYFLAFFGFDTWDKVREFVPPSSTEIRSETAEVMITDSGKYSVYIPCGIEIADCHDEKIAKTICKLWNSKRFRSEAEKEDA